MRNGYVRLHRRIQESNVWQLRSAHITTAETCLLNAVWQPEGRKVHGFQVERGQWLTHYHEIADKAPPDVTAKVARTALSHLASRNVRFLGTRSVTLSGLRFILITIWNYDKYNPLKGPISGRRAHGRAHGGHMEGTTLPEEGEEVENNVKRQRPNVDNSGPDPQDLIARIVELTGDAKSGGGFAVLIAKHGHDYVEGKLGEYRDKVREGFKPDNPGAYFTGMCADSNGCG